MVNGTILYRIVTIRTSQHRAKTSFPNFRLKRIPIAAATAAASDVRAAAAIKTVTTIVVIANRVFAVPVHRQYAMR